MTAETLTLVGWCGTARHPATAHAELPSCIYFTADTEGTES